MAAGVLLALASNVAPLRRFPPVQIFHSGATAIVTPFVMAGNAVFRGVGHIAGWVPRVIVAERDNHDLRTRVAELTAQQAVQKELVKENQKLRDALGFRGTNPYSFNLSGAQVIGRSPDRWFEALLINRGSRDAIRPEQAVLSDKGLVGRIMEVNLLSASVMMLTDPRSAVSGSVSRTSLVGLVVSAPRQMLAIKYLPLNADVQVGDDILTSGISDIFPKGIPIGSVVHVGRKENEFFLDVHIKPAVDFSSLHQLFIARR